MSFGESNGGETKSAQIVALVEAYNQKSWTIEPLATYFMWRRVYDDYFIKTIKRSSSLLECEQTIRSFVDQENTPTDNCHYPSKPISKYRLRP